MHPHRTFTYVLTQTYTVKVINDFLITKDSESDFYMVSSVNFRYG